MKSSAGYRIWQFWHSLKKSPSAEEMDLVKSVLTPAELELFQKLPIPDQNHSIRVFDSIRIQGEEDLDLLKAALLHDLGKIKFPLQRWERVFSVLIKGLFSNRVKDWGNGKPAGLGRPLVVINHHPDWGADYAETVGSSPLTIWLIRNHEREKLEGSLPDRKKLLLILQKADDQN